MKVLFLEATHNANKIDEKSITIMKQPRVLVVGAFPPPDREIFGGIVTVCRTLLASSLPDRMDLDLIDSTQISNPPPGGMVRFMLAARRFVRFVVRFERHRPDAVLLFTSSGLSLVEKGSMAWYARFRRVPVLMFPRGGAVLEACAKSRFSRVWVRIAYRGARIVLCQGPMWRRFVTDTLGRPSSDAPIIPNWTATENLLEVGRNRTLEVSQKPLRLLFLGWLEREKGIFELLEACSRLVEKNNFLLDIAGKGHADKSVREFVIEKKIVDRVRFLGWIKGPELEEAYAQADIFVLPSWKEGMPNAMIEAMATRLAVVVTTVGNIPDFLTDEQQALLISPKDTDALTSALNRVINDRDLRLSLASNGHTFVEKTFAVEPAVDQLEKAILSVLDATLLPKPGINKGAR